MDFSINNFNLEQKKINFKGMDGAYHSDSTPVYKFYAPPHSKDEKVYLEMVILEPDEETASFKKPEKKEKYTLMPFHADDTLEFTQEKIKNHSPAFAYRYLLKNTKTQAERYEVDAFRKMPLGPNGENMNVIEQGEYYGINPKGGTMRHSFLDADVKLNGEKPDFEYNKTFVRNHFNKLGGSVKGLLWLLRNPEGKKELEPYRYFMTTPIIGADKVSSHKYWPVNQYQCGDFGTFKDFNFELFKQGKGYVADGAFTSQGIQSPLFQHVFKWGNESPFYYMLRIDGDIGIGVLPNKSVSKTNDPYDHMGVRLINPLGKNYQKNKPTYIQFYDDRLLSEEKQNDGKIHFDTDIIPEDHYDITSHEDSVQPYAFEIDPYDKKIKSFKGKNAILLKDLENVEDFMQFKFFKIAVKNKVTGINCWDGNVDMIKMYLSNSNKLDEKSKEGVRAARNYLLGVATYWTETVQSHLILETAKLNDKDKANIAKANDISDERSKEIEKSIKDGSFKSLILKQNKSTEEYIKEFPLQSLETSEELSAVFAQPQFQGELLEKNGEKVTSLFNEIVDSIIPNKYKNDNNYKTYIVKTYQNEILRYIFANAMRPEAINKNGTINEKELQEVTLKSFEKHISTGPDDERSQVISAITSGLENCNTGALQAKLSKEIKSISLEDFKLAEAIVLQGKGGLNWRFDAAKDIGDLDAARDHKTTFHETWDGEEGVEKFWTQFVSNIRTYNPASFVINEITCLNEFHEDGDDYDPALTKQYNGLSSSEKGLDDNKPKNTKQRQFLYRTNSTTASEFSRGFNAFSEFAGTNPEKESKPERSGNLSRLKNEKMDGLLAYEQPNSVIYSHMFTSNHDKPSTLHTLPLNMKIYLADDGKKGLRKLCTKELTDEAIKAIKKLSEIDKVTKEGTSELTDEAIEVIKKLTGIDKVTKEGTSELTDEAIEVIKKLTGIDKVIKKPELTDETVEEIKKLTGIDKIENFDQLCSLAVSVGLAMQKTINESKNYTEEQKEALNSSLRNLVLGKKTKDADPNYKRAQSFGVKPYEITVVDLIKGANKWEEKDVENVAIDFLYEFLESSMMYYERLWQVMNACTGTPTLYGGHEFAQTGYETSSKNVYLGIRNGILHHLKDDYRKAYHSEKAKGYKGHKGYKDYYDKMHETSNLYRNPELSALRDGAPISLDISTKVKDIDIKDEDMDFIKANLKDEDMDFIKANLKDVIQQTIQEVDKKEIAKKLTEDAKKFGKNINEINEKLNGYLNLGNKNETTFVNVDINKDKIEEAVKKAVEKEQGNEIKNEKITRIAKKLSSEINKKEEHKYEEGFDLLLKIYKYLSEAEKDGSEVEIWPIYKKNAEGSQTLSIITNLGMPNGKLAYETKAEKEINYNVKEIEITKKENKEKKCPLENGTILERYGSDQILAPSERYVVFDGKIVIAKKGKDGKYIPSDKEITLKDTVTTFYVPKKKKISGYILPQYNYPIHHS